MQMVAEHIRVKCQPIIKNNFKKLTGTQDTRVPENNQTYEANILLSTII